MSTVTPSYSVSLSEPHGEIHFKVAGFHTTDSMGAFLDELNKTAMPLLKAGRKMRALGDMSEFVPQDRETGSMIANHLERAQQNGLERIAVLTESALVMMQYKRLSAGIEVEFFKTKEDAVHWLRRS